MKKSYFTIAMFYISVIVFVSVLNSPTYSQSSLPIDEETGLITYREVVKVEGTKETFFNRAIGWINKFYKNPVDVTKTRDAESGVIKGLHRFKIKNTDEDGIKSDAGVVQYRFTLELKEGRYRYTLYEFVLRQTSKVPVEKWLDKNDPQYNPAWRDYLKQVDDFAETWIESLKEGMKPEEVKKEDEW